MATTTSDDPELEGRMHVGDAAREIVAKLDGGVRVTLTGSPVGSVRRVVLLTILALALTWPDPVAMLGVSVLVITASQKW